MSSLQDQLRHAAGPAKPELVREIEQAEAVVAALQKRKAAVGGP